MTGPAGPGRTADPDAIARRVSERAERTRRRQLETAVAKLDDDRRDELAALCDQLTERVLAGSLAALDVAGERDDRELARAVATLFDVERERTAVEDEYSAREAVAPGER